MPEVSGGYEPASGPLLRLAIWPGDAAREILSGAPPNTRAFRSYIALLDSGADVTCISPRVVEELAISPFGKVLLEGVNEVVLTNLFEFGIGLPPGEQENLEQSLGDGRDLHVEFVEQGA